MPRPPQAGPGGEGVVGYPSAQALLLRDPPDPLLQHFTCEQARRSTIKYGGERTEPPRSQWVAGWVDSIAGRTKAGGKWAARSASGTQAMRLPSTHPRGTPKRVPLPPPPIARGSAAPAAAPAPAQAAALPPPPPLPHARARVSAAPPAMEGARACPPRSRSGSPASAPCAAR